MLGGADGVPAALVTRELDLPQLWLKAAVCWVGTWLSRDRRAAHDSWRRCCGCSPTGGPPAPSTKSGVFLNCCGSSCSGVLCCGLNSTAQLAAALSRTLLRWCTDAQLRYCTALISPIYRLTDAGCCRGVRRWWHLVKGIILLNSAAMVATCRLLGVLLGWLRGRGGRRSPWSACWPVPPAFDPPRPSVTASWPSASSSLAACDCCR